MKPMRTGSTLLAVLLAGWTLSSPAMDTNPPPPPPVTIPPPPPPQPQFSSPPVEQPTDRNLKQTESRDAGLGVGLNNDPNPENKQRTGRVGGILAAGDEVEVGAGGGIGIVRHDNSGAGGPPPVPPVPPAQPPAPNPPAQLVAPEVPKLDSKAFDDAAGTLALTAEQKTRIGALKKRIAEEGDRLVLARDQLKNMGQGKEAQAALEALKHELRNFDPQARFAQGLLAILEREQWANYQAARAKK